MSRDTKHLSPDDSEVWESFTKRLGENTHGRPAPHIYYDDALGDRLDLHGYTLHAAWLAFSDFIGSHRSRGTREVVVVTGSSGRMREEFSHWCDAVDGIAGCHALPSTSGKVGAYRVRLRRP